MVLLSFMAVKTYENNLRQIEISAFNNRYTDLFIQGEPQRKEGCHWLLMTHETCTTEQVVG